MVSKPLKSGNNRPVILFDMDDVITDCLGGVVDEWNLLNGTSFTRTDVDKWDIDACLGEGAHLLFRRKGFFRDLKEKKDSVTVIKKLIESARYDIYIVTACQSVQEIEEKIHWLQCNVPGFNINRFIACKEKFMVRGDIIVDDRTENLIACQKYMDCIVYDMPHNQHATDFQRITSLSEVIDILDKTFYA